MSQIIEEPEADTAPSPVAPVVPVRGRRAVRITAVVAFVGVLVALVGMVLLTRPLRTPTQDCGTPISFLTGGRQNVFVDPKSPPKGVTTAEAQANNDEPCQERAFNRALPAGMLVIGGTFTALVAMVVEAALRFRYSRSTIMEPWQTPPEAPSP